MFKIMFQERLLKVRCRPGDPIVGALKTTVLTESGELSGSFDIELARCEDANTGKALGWLPQPFLLHGSFDRLTPDAGAEGR
ncbi:MAG: hypothetical protein ACI841_001049 [Planctomycetota bacterium]